MKRTYRIWILPICLLLLGAGTSAVAQVKVKAKAEKKEKQGWLGVSIQDVTQKLAKSMDLKTTEGVLISGVSEDSPAEKAGLKEQDVIVEFAGKKVKDTEGFVKMVRATKPESKVKIVYLRGEEKKTADVSVGENRKETASVETVPSIIPDHFAVAPGMAQLFSMESRKGTMGMQVSELNDQLAEYFGVPDGGVLVEEVAKGSAAEKGGFKAGDVIVKIGKKNVDELSDITRVLGAHDPGDTLSLDVVRKGQRLSLSVVLEKGEREDPMNIYMRRAPQMNILGRRPNLSAPPAPPHIQMDRYIIEDDGGDSEIEIAPNLEKLEKSMKDLQLKLGKKMIRIKVDGDGEDSSDEELESVIEKNLQRIQEPGNEPGKEGPKEIRIRITKKSGSRI